MTERRRATPSIWKKMKTAIKSFVGIRSKKPLDAHTDTESSPEMSELEENKWVSACRYVPGSSRRIVMVSLFDRIEGTSASDLERIDLFKQQAPKEMQEWWIRLTLKPQTWGDLKEWLTEDIDSVEDTQPNRHTHQAHQSYHRPPQEKE